MSGDGLPLQPLHQQIQICFGMTQLVYVNTEGAWLDAIRELFREYEAELGENLCFQGFDEEMNDPLVKYAAPGGAIILALVDGKAAGCIALYQLKTEGDCEMKRLYVRPAFRKHKIGEELVAELLAAAIQKGYRVMKLDTLEKLQPAIRLYKKFDFSETTAYYENPLQGVVYMERQLAD